MRAANSREHPLRRAIGGHDLEATKRALAEGADLNADFDQRRSMLAMAAAMGGPKSDVPIVRYLLDQGANANGLGVVEWCRPDLLNEIIAAGGNVNGDREDGAPLFRAIIARRKEDKALMLIEAGARLDVREAEGQTPLIAAARCARSRVLRRLLERGADPLAVDDTGRSALRHAIEALASAIDSDVAPLRTIARALQKYAPAQPEDLALTAIVTEDLDALANMLDRGMDVNVRIPGTIGYLGLSIQTLIGMTGGLIELLTGGVAQSNIDPLVGGTTLIMWAVALKKAVVVQFLLERGADPNLRMATDVSACDLSIRSNHAGIKRLLGTSEISSDEHPPGRDFIPMKVPTSRPASDTRASRLNIDLRRTAERMSYLSNLKDQPAASAIEALWELASLRHANDDEAGRDQALRGIIPIARDWYGRADSGLEEICPYFWMRPFCCALAAASILRDEAIATLARWCTPDRPRGGRSPMYNERYFRWPLYMHWCDRLAGRKPNARWRKLIDEETARLPKFLLVATDAIEAADAKSLIASLKRSLAIHKKLAMYNGDVIAERILMSEVCFLASEAKRRAVLPKVDAALSDWLIAEAS